MNRSLSIFFLLFGLNMPAILCAQRKVTVTSPDKKIAFTAALQQGHPVYSVKYGAKEIVAASSLGLSFNDGFSADSAVHFGKAVTAKKTDNYTLVVGKADSITVHYTELLLPMHARFGQSTRTVNLLVRVFNDGLAFRYDIPAGDNWNSYSLTSENTGFHLAGNPMSRALYWANQFSSHEGFYQRRALADVPTDSLLDLPSLFMYPDGTCVAITEASLRNYAGMYLKKKNGILQTWLSPLPGQNDIRVKASLPHETPWRVLMIASHIGTLMESHIITALNDAPAPGNYDWVKPGKTSFHWWNGDVVPDTSFEAGANFMTNRYYIDFCARNKIQYHSVIGFAGQPWYVNDGGANYQPGPGTDITRTIPNINIEEICKYAKSKGVDIHVWVHWRALYPKLDTAFALFEKWGIKGMMVDFMDRDDQEMVNIQEEILAKAVKHHLFIQFHGAFKPTGLHRTYPSEFTREGTHNYEQNKWSPAPVSADHDLDMPFTRLLAGAADYHLGGFRAAPKGQWKTQFSRPLMDGTRAHMLAMYVVFESYLASLCDFPQAYEGQDGFAFLQTVPTSWQETKVPAASIDQYATVARRKGRDWWMGTINSSETRKITVPLTFLGSGQYTAIISEDGPNADQQPNILQHRSVTVSAKDTLTFQLAASGGAVVHFEAIP